MCLFIYAVIGSHFVPLIRDQLNFQQFIEGIFPQMHGMGRRYKWPPIFRATILAYTHLLYNQVVLSAQCLVYVLSQFQ